MVTQKQAYDYYMKMYNEGSIYVWGFNSGTIISQRTINKTYEIFKSSKYTKDYYDYKLKEGKGKNGSDCSGAHFGLSNYDTTAQGYYNLCTKKASISSIPKNKLVLLFSGNSPTSITHTGAYLGNGMVFHMKNSTANAVYEPLEKYNWKWWGYANFISDYDTFSFEEDEKWDNVNWIKNLQKTLGVAADGIFGKKSLAATPVISTKKNNTHATVKFIQEKLNYLGFDCGEVDGVFGNNTYKAVLAYQSKNDLDADGIVGNNTWEKIVK